MTVEMMMRSHSVLISNLTFFCPEDLFLEKELNQLVQT